MCYNFSLGWENCIFHKSVFSLVKKEYNFQVQKYALNKFHIIYYFPFKEAIQIFILEN